MSGQVSTSAFISQRMEEVEALKAQLNIMSEGYNREAFLHSPAEGMWSVAQVLDHLNGYNRYYLAAIKAQLDKPAQPPAQKTYRAGWLGDYFTKLMLPSAPGKKTVKMKSPKEYEPASFPDPESMIREFISGEEKLIMLLEKSRAINLERVRIPISLNRFIRLKLGDTFHFLIAHQQRHFLQMQKILDNANMPLKTTEIQ
jgi:DinB superfamily